MTESGKEQFETWLTDFQNKIEQLEQEAQQTQEQVRELRGQASSADGTVSVVLAPGGKLDELTLSPRAMELGPQKLAAVIKQTVQAAHADAAGQTENMLESMLGDTDAMSFFREQLNPETKDDQDTAAASRSSSGAGNDDARQTPDRGDDDTDEDSGGSVMQRR